MAKKAFHFSKNADTKRNIVAFLVNTGLEVSNKGDYEHAIMLLNECAALDKQNETAHLFLGKAFLKKQKDGDLKTAITEFKTAEVVSDR